MEQSTIKLEPMQSRRLAQSLTSSPALTSFIMDIATVVKKMQNYVNTCKSVQKLTHWR